MISDAASSTPGDRAGGDGRIGKLIVNSPYAEPTRHWQYNPLKQLDSGGLGGYERIQGRRPPGYRTGRAADDQDRPLELAARIRKRVKRWREARYPGVTGVTKRLLDHWNDREGFAQKELFFAQMEAAETLIWLAEAPEADKTGVRIPSDGSEFTRICSKMATGTGKTVVMAMLIAWHVINKASYPRDTRFAKDVLVIAPGLTVRRRLEVLKPKGHDNYYKEFNIVPDALRDKLRQGRVEIRNWHALQTDDEAKVAKRKGVDKRGPLSDEAWARQALGGVAGARRLLVINDEAHHAWRKPADRTESQVARAAKIAKAEVEEATKWVAGLDRIHRARGILACHDFTATPFVPSRESEELFGWVVSDFGLNDAIESGLVKTPRVVVRDNALPDAETYRPRLYHIYNENSVKESLNRSRAAPEEPLPELVRSAYLILGDDWQQAHQAWQDAKSRVPPVMITVVNRTETAARIKYAFDSGAIDLPELCDPELTLHIDSKVLSQAEETETPIAEPAGAEDSSDGSVGGTARRLTRKEQAELLRRQVDTVGIPDQPGEQIRHVISVAMLSEGWDAKTVTHIMGLRAFTSQLLCEQVIGRGLRRTSYEIGDDGLFAAEHVNIFGVPFELLPAEDDPTAAPPSPKPKTKIRPEPAKLEYEIAFPNLQRVERVSTARLSLDPSLEPLVLDAAELPTEALLTDTLQGEPPDAGRTRLLSAPRRRLQEQLFMSAEALHARLKRRDEQEGRRLLPSGNPALLRIELVNLLDEFVRSGRLSFSGDHRASSGGRRVGSGGKTDGEHGAQDEPDDEGEPQSDEADLSQLIQAHQQRIFEHLESAIVGHNTERLEPVFDDQRPILSTGDLVPWWTSKPNGPAAKSHINRCVYDSELERKVAKHLDRSGLVEAWAKNDHLGFEVKYMHGGVTRRYIPDFIVRLASGRDRAEGNGNTAGGRASVERLLVLEVKGDPLDIDRSKRDYMKDWVTAVNTHGGFGVWSEDMYTPDDDLDAILARHARR